VPDLTEGVELAAQPCRFDRTYELERKLEITDGIVDVVHTPGSACAQDIADGVTGWKTRSFHRHDIPTTRR